MRRRDLAAMHDRAVRGRRAPDAAAGPFRMTLWLPTTAIFLLLAPFALLTLPLLYLAPRDIVPRPAATLAAIGGLLLSLGGTSVEVDSPDARIRLRLF
jgi:hypothetical protein